MSELAQVIEFPAERSSEFYPLVEPGRYTVAFIRHRTVFLFRQPKLVLDFRIVDMGPHFGKELARFYNVKRLTGPPRKGGGFKAGRSSDFIREYASVASARLTRLDRVPVEALREVLVSAEVRTVTADHRQRALASTLHYSVIARILGVADH